MTGTRILFVDRDGVLLEEPADEQVDSFDKFRLVPGAIPAMLRLRDAGFEFVMVSNQDGLGTPSFPLADFEGPQRLLLQVLYGIRSERLPPSSEKLSIKSNRRAMFGRSKNFIPPPHGISIAPALIFVETIDP